MTSQPTISDFSTTAASNSEFNGIGILGTNLVSTADNAFRSLAAMLAGYSKDLAGIGQTVGGTANSLTITAAEPWTALANGLMLAFKNTVGINTSAVALVVTPSGGAAFASKAIRLQGDTALVGGEMVANGIYLLRYDTAYNSAAGAWVLLNPDGKTQSGTVISTGSTVSYTAFQGISTEAAAAAGPILDLYRNSASPAAADVIAEIDFTGQNTTPAKKTFASINTRIDTATAASEAATLQIATMKAGALTNYLTPGANAAGTATANATGLPLGQLSFPAAQNASSDANTLDDYEEGTHTPTITAGTGTLTTVTGQGGTYTKIGNLVALSAVWGITTNGTGASTLAFTVPFSAASAVIEAGVGRENSVTGKEMSVVFNLVTRTSCAYYDNSYPGVNGGGYRCCISYGT